MKIWVVLLLVLLSAFMNTASASTPYIEMGKEAYSCSDTWSFNYYWADNSTFVIYESSRSAYDYTWWSYDQDSTEYNGSAPNYYVYSDSLTLRNTNYILLMFSEETVWNATLGDWELSTTYQGFDTFSVYGCSLPPTNFGGGGSGGGFDPFAGSNNQTGGDVPIYDFQSWFDVDGDGEYDYAEKTQSFRNWGMIVFLGSLVLVITKFILRMPLW